MMSILLATALLGQHGTNADHDARAAIAIAQASEVAARPVAPIKPPEPVAPASPVEADFPRLRYLEAWARSVASGKPLVTFVGLAPVYSLGDVAIPVEMPRGWFADYPSSCVIIGRPSGDTLHWFRTLSAAATEDDIRSAIAPRPVMQPAYQPQMFAPSFGGFGGGGGFSRGGGGSC